MAVILRELAALYYGPAHRHPRGAARRAAVHPLRRVAARQRRHRSVDRRRALLALPVQDRARAGGSPGRPPAPSGADLDLPPRGRGADRRPGRSGQARRRAGGMQLLHHAARRVRGAGVPPHRSGRSGRRHPRGGPVLRRRVRPGGPLREHPGAADRGAWRGAVHRPRPGRAHDDAGRVRAPGPHVRGAAGEAPAGARSEPAAADLVALQRRPGGARGGPPLRGADGSLQLEPAPLRELRPVRQRRGEQRPGRPRVPVQRRAVRRRVGAALDGQLPGAAARGGGEPGDVRSTSCPIVPARRAPADAALERGAGAPVRARGHPAPARLARRRRAPGVGGGGGGRREAHLCRAGRPARTGWPGSCARSASGAESGWGCAPIAASTWWSASSAS